MSELMNYGDEVCKINFTTLRILTAILTIICGSALFFSIIMPPYSEFIYPYALLFSTLIIFSSLIGRVKNKNLAVVLCLYAIMSMFFLFTIYLSVFVSPEFRATTLLGLIAITPFVVLDKGWRVNLFLLVFVAVHSMLSFMYKGGGLSFGDFVDSAIISVIAMSIGASSRNIRMGNLELRHQALNWAYVDFLTGLYNRRKMYEFIIESENGGPQIKGVILFDIDLFKGFNDSYGHQSGDDCLRRLGAQLKKFGEKHSIEIFRFGGEEFLCFDYERNYEELCGLAEALRNDVLSMNIPYPDSFLGRVSVSAGFAVQRRVHPISIESMICIADHALYQAKSNGRNCCVGISCEASKVRL